MRKLAAIILSAAATVMFSGDAEARRLRLSFGSSAPKAATVPLSKPATANTSSNRWGGTFVVVGTNRDNQNRPFAAAPRDPVPVSGPLHEMAAAMDQTPPVTEKPAEQPAEQKPEPPAVRTTPVFVSLAAPKPVPVAERTATPAQPTKMVYCTMQAKGGCAPF